MTTLREQIAALPVTLIHPHGRSRSGKPAVRLDAVLALIEAAWPSDTDVVAAVVEHHEAEVGALREELAQTASGRDAAYERWVQTMADALHEDCRLEWQAIAVADPGRAVTQHMADAHYGRAHDLVRRILPGLDAVQGSRPVDSTVILDGTERADGYDRDQQLGRRIGKWLDDLALAGSLSPDERRDIHVSIGAPAERLRDSLAAGLADALTIDWPIGDTRLTTAPAIADYLLHRPEVRAALGPGLDPLRIDALERLADAALNVVTLPPHIDAYSTEDRRRIWTNALSEAIDALPRAAT